MRCFDSEYHVVSRTACPSKVEEIDELILLLPRYVAFGREVERPASSEVESLKAKRPIGMREAERPRGQGAVE